MGKVLVVLLGVVIVVEVLLVIGVAGALFWTGGPGMAAVGAAMLLVTAVASFLALRSARPRR